MIHAISQRHNLLGSLTLACALLFGAACTEDPGENPNNQNNVTGGDTGSINVSSTVIEFNQVPLGSTDTKELLITNVGQGSLRLNKITLVENDEDDQREISPGEGWKNSAVLKPNESLSLKVQWSPKTTIRDTGKIIIDSSDPSQRMLEVTLNSPLLAPKLFSPPVVQFPRVPTGTTQKQLTFIQNTGQSPLQLKGVILSPPSNAEFSVTFPDPADPADESKDKSVMDHATLLDANEQIPMRVAFTPDSDQPSTADIVLYSSDPDAAQYTIKLSGNAGTPCIELGGARTVEVPTGDETHLLQFGPSQIGRATNKTVQIRNCSRSEELTVDEVVLSDSAGGVYELVESALPGELPTSPLKVAPLESETFVIAYTPEDETTNIGRVEVRNDDPVNANLKVDINGKGTNNVCPVAVGEATIVNGSSRPSATISTIPLKTVQLTGARSTDPNGSVDRYEWNIVQKPVNSTARLQPNNNSPEPRLFLDLAGEYVIELTVTDDLGLDSCDTSTVRIQATPDEDIHIQLVWDTPGDADQTDPYGTDVDIHYLHPLGKWDEAPYDIFWRNPSADWGIPGNTSDDPSLDIDDTDGAGPENVNHDNPESGKSYAVGAYYYNDNGYGPIYATIRIYIEGTEQFKLIDKYMEREDSFWDVAAIVWPSKQIIARDRVRLGFP